MYYVLYILCIIYIYITFSSPMSHPVVSTTPIANSVSAVAATPGRSASRRARTASPAASRPPYMAPELQSEICWCIRYCRACVCVVCVCVCARARVSA